MSVEDLGVFFRNLTDFFPVQENVQIGRLKGYKVSL